MESGLRRGSHSVIRVRGRLSRRYAAKGRVIVGLAVLACAGCGPAWHFDFEAAEGQARSLERSLVVFYKDPLDLRSSQVEDWLEGPEVAPLLQGKVLCKLVNEFPPNRRYVAQYGVLQPPGLVLIHPDGTYHAHNGPMTPQQIGEFLAQAQPPGARPRLNPQIARTINYRWEGIYEDAVAKARRQNRELLIVYKWWLSGECTELLTIFQTRPEVARHFTETVNCLLDMDYPPNRVHVRKYGATRVPTVILVHRDGTYHAHSGPMTADQIVRFVTAAKAPGKRPLGEFADRRVVRASYRWYSDLNRAAAHARNRGLNVFVFYHSLYSDQSNRMARLLDRNDVAALFEGTINCRLDFSVPANRQLMARYRVGRAPAFVVVRPDGTYHARTGVVGRADLVELLGAAERPGLSPARARGP